MYFYRKLVHTCELEFRSFFRVEYLIGDPMVVGLDIAWTNNVGSVEPNHLLLPHNITNW